MMESLFFVTAFWVIMNHLHWKSQNPGAATSKSETSTKQAIYVCNHSLLWPAWGKEVDWVFKKHKTLYQLKDHGVLYGAFHYVQHWDKGHL